MRSLPPIWLKSEGDNYPARGGLIDVDAILCSDSAAVYAHFSKAEGIAHRPVNPSRKRRVDGPFHIQNVNAYDSRLKGWMIPFHGVATKCLTHYLGWRRLLERYK